MKIISVVLLAMFLASCASIPDTSDGLVASTDIKASKCYTQEQTIVGKKVRDFLEYCYRVQTIEIPIAGVLVPMTSEYQVIEESDGTRMRYSVRSRYGFGIAVDIRPGMDSCKTRVDMFALRNHLREKFQRIDDAINDKDPTCGII